MEPATTPTTPTTPAGAPITPTARRSHHKKPPDGAEGAGGASDTPRGAGRPSALAASQCTPEALGALDPAGLTATLRGLQGQKSANAQTVAQHYAQIEALEAGAERITAAIASTVAMLRHKGVKPDALKAEAQRRKLALEKALADNAAFEALLTD